MRVAMESEISATADKCSEPAGPSSSRRAYRYSDHPVRADRTGRGRSAVLLWIAVAVFFPIYHTLIRFKAFLFPFATNFVLLLCPSV